MKKNIGFALISTRCKAGDAIEVVRQDKVIAGTLTELPFL
jgi:hypothetical protein